MKYAYLIFFSVLCRDCCSAVLWNFSGSLYIQQLISRIKTEHQAGVYWLQVTTSSVIINYLFTSNISSLLENFRPWPCRIDWAISRSIQQGLGLWFSCKDQTSEVNKLFIIWLFTLFFAGLVGITIYRKILP